MESNPTSKTFFKKVVSPLQSALLKGSIDKIEKILCEKFGAKLSSHEDEVNKCKEIVQVCLDFKINLNHPEDKYSTLLHFVANKLDDETFKSVLSRITDLNINGLYKGRALLHFIAEEGKEDLAKHLLEFGADVDVKDLHQETPLFYAISENYPQLVRLLLDSGGTVHYENFMLGLHDPMELWFISQEIVEMLLDAGYDVSVKKNGMVPADFIFDDYYSTGNYSWKNVKLMCAYGSDMNLKNETGTELIHYFCKNGLLDDVLFAVKYGADLFGKESGNTALHRSVFGNNFDLVDFLLRHGLDVNAKDSYNGESPLHRLSKFCNNPDYFQGLGPEFREERTKQFVAMIEFIVDNGADVNARDNVSFAPVERSLHLNFLDISQCFFELNAVVDFERNIFWLSKITALSDNKCATIVSQRNNTFKLLVGILATKEDDVARYLQRVPDLSLCESIKSFFNKCRAQVNQMKSSNICRDRNISFFEFLTKDLMEVAIFSRNEEIMLVLESGKFKRKFPSYKYLFEKRVERVQLLRNYINAFTHFLEQFFSKKLPLVVMDIILRFLSVGDLRNFARALKISEDFPNGKYSIE